MSLRQCLANLALASWIAAEVVRIVLFASTWVPGLVDIMLIAALVVAVIFVLARPQPTLQDSSAVTLTVALAAVVCPLLYQLLPAGQESSPSSSAVQGMAVLFMLGATFSLGRNFSVVPQYRWLVHAGPYMLVRHPMYAGYLVFDAAHAFEHASSLALAIWLSELALLDWRARREEALLACADQGYLEYMLQVRWRFFPHLI